MGSKRYRNRRSSHSKDSTDEDLKRLAETYAMKYNKDKDFIINKENKLSAAIIDIAQPLLDLAETPEDMKGILHMAMAAWMMAVLPEELTESKMKETVQRLYDDTPEFLDVMLDAFEEMIERKLELYPDDQRVPLDYEMNIIGDSLQFNVVGTPIDDSRQK